MRYLAISSLIAVSACSNASVEKRWPGETEQETISIAESLVKSTIPMHIDTRFAFERVEHDNDGAIVVCGVVRTPGGDLDIGRNFAVIHGHASIEYAELNPMQTVERLCNHNSLKKKIV